jgi:hypothetical protein
VKKIKSESLKSPFPQVILWIKNSNRSGGKVKKASCVEFGSLRIEKEKIQLPAFVQELGGYV